MIEFQNVTKMSIEHGVRRCVMENASFVIPNRTSVAVFSSMKGDNLLLLKLISGVIPLDNGKVRTNSTISWPVGETIGLQNTISARQNIKLVCGINGIGAGKCRRITEMIAEFSGLGKHIDDPMETYAAGMKARLAFLLPLTLQFDYYLVGGRTSTGSGQFKNISEEFFQKTVKKSAVILATNNFKEAKSLCQAAIVVKDGKAEYYEDIDDAIDFVAHGKSAKKRARKNPRKKPRKPARKAAKKAALKKARKVAFPAEDVAQPARKFPKKRGAKKAVNIRDKNS